MNTSSLTIAALVFLDILGVLVIFNINHWIITSGLAPNLLLTWKLVLVASATFLFYYLMDLYTFESMLSQLGMLERSFIAIVLTGVTVALLVYLIGPAFIGGFVGRGVLASSLLMVWLWSLGIRYLLNYWIKLKRHDITWLVLADAEISQFLDHFRSVYGVEQVRILTPLLQSSDIVARDGVKVQGTWSELDEVLAGSNVAGIIVAAPDQLPEQLLNRLMSIRIAGTRIFTLNDFYEKYLTRLPVSYLDRQWLTLTHGFDLIHNPIGLRFKRYIDILIAIILGTVLMPVLLLIATIIVATSGFPILYRQERTGENGRRFVAFKFRTMVKNAEQDGAQFAVPDDPRITTVGRILRKFRLDELPQLWNVLVGDMSFIGPRPERPEFVTELQQRIPYYNLRHIVKPGITGWAQVMYGYGDSTEDAAEKLQYDLYYIKNYSLMLDISIMLKTIKVVLFGTGR